MPPPPLRPPPPSLGGSSRPVIPRARPSQNGGTGAGLHALDRPSPSGSQLIMPKKEETTFFLGRYRVISEIGRGGMASVHLGRIDGPGGFHKWVAIKQIHGHLIDSDQFVDMFLDEARMAAGINHANVAQVFDIGKEGDGYWIVMEYLHGEPLRELMRHQEEVAKSPVSVEVAARICADAAEGLHAAHEVRGKNGELLGLVHRDVTPHNLFVTYDGYTKVVDFGIARATGRLSTTTHGQLKGKIAYMSPEQVRNQEMDRRTDVFALGIVLWELSTNHRLFRMENDIDTLERVFAGVVPKPSSVVRGYPVELEEIVMKALAQSKTERYQSARELSRALHAFLAHSGAYVAWEDVSSVMRRVFGAELKRRDQHLAWAGDVTNTTDAPMVALKKLVRREAEALVDEEDATIARDSRDAIPKAYTEDLDEESAETIVHDRSSSVPAAPAAKASTLPPPNPPARKPGSIPPPAITEHSTKPEKRGALPSLDDPTLVMKQEQGTSSSSPPPLPKRRVKDPATIEPTKLTKQRSMSDSTTIEAETRKIPPAVAASDPPPDSDESIIDEETAKQVNAAVKLASPPPLPSPPPAPRVMDVKLPSSYATPPPVPAPSRRTAEEGQRMLAKTHYNQKSKRPASSATVTLLAIVAVLLFLVLIYTLVHR